MPVAMAVVSQNQKRNVPHFDCLDIRNVVVPLTMLVAHVMPTLVPGALHDQKSPAAPHFSHLYLRNAIVPLTMPSASHADYFNANGST